MAVFYEKEGKIVTIRLDLTETLNRADAQTFQTLSSSLTEERKPEYKGR